MTSTAIDHAKENTASVYLKLTGVASFSYQGKTA